MQKIKEVLLIMVLCTSAHIGFAQDEVIESIHILQQPIMEEADSNVVLEYGYGWMDGYDVVYKCLITKIDSTELNTIKLVVSLDQDTILTNNYNNSYADTIYHILNNGESAMLAIDTLPYSSDYQFTLEVLDNDSLLQQINYIETFN